MKIYLDNAATTPVLPEVINTMQKTMATNYGNPSSTHQLGRSAKAVIETARKSIATKFNANASEFVFTSSGTEANNLIIYNAITNLKVKHIITSKIEHYAVLNTVKQLKKTHKITVSYVKLNGVGEVDLHSLEALTKNSSCKTMVSLMMINNEIGNILPIDKVLKICKKHNVLFHSDTVQAVGHFSIDLKNNPIDFITASAHKFHGPKGIGFACFKKGTGIAPMFFGGNQEKGVRASTENVHGIAGMNKAIQLAYSNLDTDREYIANLKKYFISELEKTIPDVEFNGCSYDEIKSSYTILNVRFPFINQMLLFQLDLEGIATSVGSACQSGSNNGSHVLAEILTKDENKNASIRFSFSKLNSKKEIDFVVSKLSYLLKYC